VKEKPIDVFKKEAIKLNELNNTNWIMIVFFKKRRRAEEGRGDSLEVKPNCSKQRITNRE
jgi:hypothetical protein